MKRIYNANDRMFGIRVNGQSVVEFDSGKYKFIGFPLDGDLWPMGGFTIGKIYENISPVEYGDPFPNALFKDDEGYLFWVDMRAFEEVK